MHDYTSQDTIFDSKMISFKIQQLLILHSVRLHPNALPLDSSSSNVKPWPNPKCIWSTIGPLATMAVIHTLVMCQVAFVVLGDLAAEASTIRFELVAFVLQAQYKLVALSLIF
jgi:hypothetical protein